VNGEVADICVGSSGTLAGYVVQKAWSNQYGRCQVVPPPPPSSAPANDGGKVMTDLGKTQYAVGLVQQSDGGFVVAGSDGGLAVLVRYRPDGTADPSFGTGGMVSTYFPEYGSGVQVKALTRLSDDTLVLVGDDAGDDVLIHYRPNGSLDTDFGGGIIRTNARTDGFLGPWTVGQPDGKLIVGGTFSRFDSSPGAFALARFNTDGTADLGFGGGGVKTTTIVGDLYALALQPDGKVLAAGTTTYGSVTIPDKFALARFNSDGSIDSRFGRGGVVRQTIRRFDSQLEAVAVQPDQHIIVAGDIFVSKSFGAEVALRRFTNNGEPDTAFGDGGWLMTGLGGTTSVQAIALPANGGIVVAGTTSQDYPSGNVSHDQFFLIRYATSGCVAIAKPRATIHKRDAAAGGDTLSMRGTATLPFPYVPALNPAANGVRILVEDASGDTIVDATIPGGDYDPATKAGWTTSGNGTIWSYANQAGVEGITQVAIAARNTAKLPGAITFRVSGKNGSYPVSAGNLPIAATLVFGPGAAPTMQCAKATFAGLVTSCSFDSTGSTLTCQ
jgi:uncharacterized delta-60 repeat protein